MMKWRSLPRGKCLSAWQNSKQIAGLEIWETERSEMWFDNLGFERHSTELKTWHLSFISGMQSGGNPGISPGKSSPVTT